MFDSAYSSARLTAGGAMAGLLFASATALAGTNYDWATVVAASPVYQTVTVLEPREECFEERIAYGGGGGASSTPPILGAIIGGALGNAVGHKKRNKQVGVVVGALLGGSIGADIARQNRGHGPRSYRTELRCHVVEHSRREERLTGYDVSYEYGGTTYRTHMRRHPGSSVRVRVHVAPVN